MDECPLIKDIDNPIIGHCDTCNGVFCIECTKIIYVVDERSADDVRVLVEGHSSTCAELESGRWTEKYGTTHRLVSVEGDTVTITEDPEEFTTREGSEEEKRTMTLKLSKEAGISPEKLKKKVGYYLKFSYDSEEIHGVAELKSNDDDAF